MSTPSAEALREEMERLRLSFENSLSWRLTRPLRLSRQLLRTAFGAEAGPEPVVGESSEMNGLDSWLEQFFGPELARLDSRLGQERSTEYSAFRDLDDDLWAMLLTQRYDAYPNIKAFLPDMPAPDLQELWNGLSDLELAAQSNAFSLKLRDNYERYGASPLRDSRVLDFGCGWGRLLRLMARYVGSENLFGCDPLNWILEICRETRVPGHLAQSAFLPERLPFEECFDLIYAFSVFTHLSEHASARCLQTLHTGLNPHGILVLTIRPPAFDRICEPLRHGATRTGDGLAEVDAFRFVPHRRVGDGSAVWGTDDGDYGDAIIPLSYFRDHWADWFELVAIDVPVIDPYQVILTLRKTS